MDLKRPIYKRTIRWTMQGLTGPLFGISLAVAIKFYQRRKVMRCVQIYWTSKRIFLQNQTALEQNALSGPRVS